MTGDGVNDIPALRAADCSIAMEEGADAARHAAQLTLLESAFGVVPEIALEGRRASNNITRSATLFLTKTIFRFLLSLLTLALPGMYPFQPIQMTLVSACTVGLPGFFLAMEPSRERIQGRFLENIIRRALPGGVAVALCATVAMLLTKAGWSSGVCSSLATGVAGFMGILALGRASWPLNRRRACIMAGSAAAFCLLASLLPRVFFLERLQGMEYAALAGLTLLGGAIYAVTAVIEKRQKKN
jgi:cation-transporting ATPase E